MTTDLFFKISLAQWSLHRTLFAREMDNLEFPAAAKQFGIDAVEYVNQFFIDKATDKRYLTELKTRADDVGVTNVLVMCDGEGELASADAILSGGTEATIVAARATHTVPVVFFDAQYPEQGLADSSRQPGADRLRRWPTRTNVGQGGLGPQVERPLHRGSGPDGRQPAGLRAGGVQHLDVSIAGYRSRCESAGAVGEVGAVPQAADRVCSGRHRKPGGVR